MGLRDLRERAGVDLNRAAELLKKRRYAYAAIELGHRKLDEAYIGPLAELFGCTVEEIRTSGVEIFGSGRKSSSMGAVLKRQRRAKNWTQRELGEACGVIHTAVSKWENSEKLSPDVMQRCAAALGIPIESFFAGDDFYWEMVLEAYKSVQSSQRRQFAEMVVSVAASLNVVEGPNSDS